MALFLCDIQPDTKGSWDSLNIYIPSNTVAIVLKGTQSNTNSGVVGISSFNNLIAQPEAAPREALRNTCQVRLGREQEDESQDGATLWVAQLNPTTHGLLSFFSLHDLPSHLVVSSLVFYSYVP